MDESILISIKKLLGLPKEYNAFDSDIIMHINTVFMVLTQLGVGPSEGFRIEDDLATWNKFIGEEDILKFNAVKSYIHLKVKLLFDPPLNSAVMGAIQQSINELEWRLNVEAETK